MPYSPFDTGWKTFAGIALFFITTMIDLPINLVCGIFHWIMTCSVNKVIDMFPHYTEKSSTPTTYSQHHYFRHRILHSGRYAHKLRNHNMATHCSSGRHSKNKQYAPCHPYQGCEDDSSNNNTSESVTTTLPRPPIKNVSSNTVPVSSPHPRHNIFRYLTGGIFGHFVLDGDTLHNVDPIQETNSHQAQRSGLNTVSPPPRNSKLRSESTSKQKPRSENKPMKPRSTKSAKPWSDKSKSKPSKPMRPNVKFKDMDLNIHSKAGQHKNRLYLDSSASVSIIFNRGILGKLKRLLNPIKIAAAGQPLIIKNKSLLHQALQHLPLPNHDLYYEPTAIANLISFAKVADEYYVICNTRIDDAIYVQSKDDGRYLRFQRCKKNNLYCLDIGEGNVDGYCNFMTVKKNKLMFSQLDQNRAKTVRILQEQCGFPSDHDFIHALECNMIPGVNFGRRDVKIANKIYGYSQGAAMGKMKQPRKGQKMDRTTKDVTSPVPLEILKYYRKVHLDMDILYVNGVAFFLATSRDLGFIHCKPVLSKHNHRVQNELVNILSDYKSRGFKVVTASGDNAFEPLKDWMKSELNVILTTCDIKSHIPRAENAIKFVKECVRCIQSEIPYKRLPRRLTIEMVRRVVVLINSFHRKSCVHPVMSPQQLLWEKIPNTYVQDWRIGHCL